MNIKIGASILTLIIWMSHLPCYAMPIDQNQIRINKQNFTDIICNVASHHCVSIGITPEEESSKYLIYLSDNDGDTWGQPIQLTRPADETPDAENNNSLGIHCNEFGTNCILIGTTYINKKRNIITYHSTDGGLTWNISNLIELPQKSTSEQSIDSIEPEVIFTCGQDGAHCVIVTHTISKTPKPLIYTTQDNGYTWTNPLEIKITTDLPLYNEEFKLTDINCSRSGLHCIFIGNYRTSRIENYELVTEYTQKSFTTQDGGTNWDTEGCHVSPDLSNPEKTVPDKLFKISCDESGKKCIAVGAGEQQIIKQTQSENYKEESSVATPYAYLSIDGGKTWVRTSKISQEPYMLPLASLSCDTEAESCIAAGFKGYPEDEDKFDAIAYITHDSGYNWHPISVQPSEKNSLFTKVFCDKSSAICHIVGLDEKYF